MGKSIDISGKRYGRWTVIKKTDTKTSSGAFMYECQCDCGTLKEVSGTLLRQGKTNSCGCLRNEILAERSKGKHPPTFKDLSGKRFGRLTVLRETGQIKSSYVVWECRCDCGNIKFVPSCNLISGNTKSCGCLAENDLSGKRFGMLVAIEPTRERKYNSVVWRCKCDCGNEAFVRADYLREWRFSSCGCNKVKDISGKRYGRLVAIKPTEKRSKSGGVIWECLCDCGEKSFASENSLENGSTQSCGCRSKEAWGRAKKAFDENELVEGTALCNLNNKIRVDNTSGCKGVYWVERVHMWRVVITFQKKTYNIGYFKDYEKAVAARKEAEEKYFSPILEKYGRSLDTADA